LHPRARAGAALAPANSGCVASAGRATAARRSAARARIDWDALARRALLVVLGTILALYVEPATRWVAQRAELRRERAALEQLERENRRLRARAAELRRGTAVEREARALGMVRVGERPYFVLKGERSPR